LIITQVFYYGDDDVEGIFEALGNQIVGDELFQDALLGLEASDSDGLRIVIKERLKKFMSVDGGVSLALTKDRSGVWKAVDYDQIDLQTDEFKPLEVIRQDNDDKGGQSKYRFRMPTYTRNPDDLHDVKVSDGWYTSDWVREPNYWSGK
jgi:hypothetical protein